MKSQTMKEIFEKIDKQLENLDHDASKALERKSMGRFFELTAEKEGVLFVYHLLKGNDELVDIYMWRKDEATFEGDE